MNIPIQPLIMLMIILVGCAPNRKNSDNNEAANKKDSVVMHEFISDEFGFSVQYPQNWKSQVLKVGTNKSVINIYPVTAADSLDFPLTIHGNEDHSYISIIPGGYGTEFPPGKRSVIANNGEKPVTFGIDNNESLSFLLENNQIWGYFIYPSKPPAGWNNYGFIYAKAAVDSLVIKCFDKESGRELAMSECNPLSGDSVIRYGNVNQEDWHTIKRILETIKFEDNMILNQSQSGENSNEIIVAQPLPGSVISSPLIITGRARGNWYFEAQFQIELMKDGKILASTTGKAQDNWMTNDYVDFSATLTFPEVKASGPAALLIRSSNPSGRKDLEKSFQVPVVINE